MASQTQIRTVSLPEPKKRGRKPKPPAPYGGPTFGLAEGEVHEVPITDLNLDDKAFQFRFALRVESLIDSIRTHGVQIPLIARPHPDGKDKLQLICGFRRATASKLAGLEKVPVIVRTLGDDEAHILSFTENEYRKTLRDLDRAHAIAKLKASGKTTGQVGELYRLSERQVQRLQGLVEYPDELKAAMDDESVLTTHALVLMQGAEKYGKKFKLGEWIERIKNEQPSVEKLRASIRTELDGKRSRLSFFRRRGDRVTLDLGAIKKGQDRERALEELRKLVSELEAAQ